MKARNLSRLLAAPFLALALGGCATLHRGQAQETTKFTVGNTERFLALDATTEASVSCTGLQERALPDGRIQVVANLRNNTPNPVSLVVGCDFLDDRGLSLGPWPWKPLVIAAGATQVVTFTAPADSAKSYAINARGAR